MSTLHLSFLKTFKQLLHHAKGPSYRFPILALTDVVTSCFPWSVLSCVTVRRVINCIVGLSISVLPWMALLASDVVRKTRIISTWKEITFQKCSDYSLNCSRERMVGRCVVLHLCHKYTNGKLIVTRNKMIIYFYLQTLGKTYIYGHHQ